MKILSKELRILTEGVTRTMKVLMPRNLCKCLRFHARPVSFAATAVACLALCGGFLPLPRGGSIYVSLGSAQQRESSFAREIFPILTAKCQGCHQATLRSGGMVATTYADFKKGGRHGSPFIPVEPANSLVIK